MFYNFVTELDPKTGRVPDVHILLDTGTTDVTSNADMYCNPGWVTVDNAGSPAQPGDALFYTGVFAAFLDPSMFIGEETCSIILQKHALRATARW